MNAALGVYQQQGNAEEASRVAINLAEAFVTTADPQAVAGRLLLRGDEPGRALRYLAARREAGTPGDIGLGLSLAEAQFRSGDPRSSAATLERLIAIDPADARPRQWLEVVRAEAP